VDLTCFLVWNGYIPTGHRHKIVSPHRTSVVAIDKAREADADIVTEELLSVRLVIHLIHLNRVIHLIHVIVNLAVDLLEVFIHPIHAIYLIELPLNRFVHLIRPVELIPGGICHAIPSIPHGRPPLPLKSVSLRNSLTSLTGTLLSAKLHDFRWS
jgi:hypothetical protein